MEKGHGANEQYENSYCICKVKTDSKTSMPDTLTKSLTYGYWRYNNIKIFYDVIIIFFLDKKKEEVRI